MVETPDIDSKRLLTCRLHIHDGPVTLIRPYAPALTSIPGTKNRFYANLSSVIKTIPSKEHLVLLGDFNARLGSDHDSWPSCL